MFSRPILKIASAIAAFMLLSLTYVTAREFSVNTHRFDPYQQFKFRVKWEGQYIPGIIHISGLNRKTEVLQHRSGGEANSIRRIPGKTVYEPITIKRGRTHDTAFEKWANKVYNYGSGTGSEVSLKDFRKNVFIELCNEAGQTVMAFKIFRCWPSRYSALNELDALNNTIAIESLVLEHEGWERDYDVNEPTEPSFTVPD